MTTIEPVESAEETENLSPPDGAKNGTTNGTANGTSNGTLNGAHAAAAVVDVVTTRRTGVSAPGPRRKYDYRLRGLDLDAVELAEAPARPTRKCHPTVRRRRRRLFVQAAVVLAAMALVAVVARATIVKPYSVSSASMVPTLQPGTDVMVLTSRFLAGSVKRGDIVVFHQPDGARCMGGRQDLVSRVIGLPGETIWSVDERIYINGEFLDEQRWHNPPFGAVGPTPIARTTVPPDSYFVMGDNRTDSCDSRSFGAVHESLLVGEVAMTTMRDGHPFVHFV
jgi:signal peptidase I